MKITLDLDEELQEALQLHLDTGKPMYAYIRAALCFFRDMHKLETGGSAVGYGNKERFKSYNTEVSPQRYLNNE